MRLLIARWVFPIARPPFRDGAVAIRQGDIVAVGRRADLIREFSRAVRTECPDAALLPGLVNCHTHLELPCEPDQGPEPFVPWVIRLIERRREPGPADQTRPAEANARAIVRSGTTTVGEVSTTGQSLTPILQAGLRAVVFREILGLQPAEAAERIAAARAAIQEMRRAAQGSRVSIGLSPHSPFALSEELFEGCRNLIANERLPVTIHAAESPAETEFLRHGSGPIPRLLYPAVGCLEPPSRRSARSAVAYLDSLGLLAGSPLLIHAVHVDVADCRLLAARGVRVAHCPRSNQRLSEGTAPLGLFEGHGIPVGLGTDSLASAPSLDLWDEMRAVPLAAPAVLGLATLGGARALGLEQTMGSLAPGKRADLIAVHARAIQDADPHASLLEAIRGADVLLSMIDGEIVHSQPGVAACA